MIMFWVVKSKNVFECLEFWENFFFSYLSYQLMLTYQFTDVPISEKDIKMCKSHFV